MHRLLLPLLVLVLLGAISGGTLTGGSVGTPSGVYRTIVVFGDNQSQSQACAADDWPSALERCDEWDQALTWIANNKTAENIDAIIYVGDLIDAGTKGVHMEDAGITVCDGTVQPEATCNARTDGTPTVAECELTGGSAGCFAYSDPPQACHSCDNWHTVITNEWTAFGVGAARMSTGDVSVPWAAVKGNHENPGLVASVIEPPGWNQNYNATYWESVDNGTTYDYLSADTYSDAAGDGHAWIMTLGTQEIIVVAMPLTGEGENYTAGAESWMKNVFDNHSTLPGFLIGHWYGRSNWPTVTTEIPSLFAIATGHVYTDVQIGLMDGPGTDDIIRIGNDFTHNSPVDTNAVAQNDYITLLRWYPDTEEVEVKYWSASGGAFMDAAAFTTATTRPGEIARVSFDIMPTPIYDLSAYSTEIADAFGTNPPNWPTPPVLPYTSTISGTAADSCAEIAAGLDTNGTHVIPADGTYSCTATQIAIAGNDVWLDMGNAVVLNATDGSSISATGSRIKVTGGAIDNNFVAQVGNINFLGTDQLVQNVIITSSNNVSIDGVRVAIVNNTIWAYSYANITSTSNSTDVNYIANHVSGGTVGEPGGSQSTSRMAYAVRLLYLKNYVENRAEQTKIRFWNDATDLLATDNYIIATDIESNLSVWLGIPSGSCTSDQINRQQTNAWFTNNKTYSAVGQAGGVGHGVDNSGSLQGPASPTEAEYCYDAGSRCEWTITGNTVYNAEPIGSYLLANQEEQGCTGTWTGNSTATYVSTPTPASLGIGADH